MTYLLEASLDANWKTFWRVERNQFKIQNSKFKIEEKTGGEVALASRRVRDKGMRGMRGMREKN
ncbi:hypothetical protein [Nostoc sp.]